MPKPVTLPQTKPAPVRTTGKELIARLIASQAPRPANPLLKGEHRGSSIGALPVGFSDKLTELETARLKKNAWAREFARLESEVKEEFETMGRDKLQISLAATNENEEAQEVRLTLTRLQGGEMKVEILDREALRELVTADVFDLCTVIQKGKVKEHAGEAVLSRITTTKTVPVEGTIVHIESEKVKGIGKGR